MEIYHGVRGEKDAHKTDDQYQAGHDCVAVAETLRYPAIDEQTQDLADIGAVAEAGLPGRGDLVCAIRELSAILLIELGEAWMPLAIIN